MTRTTVSFDQALPTVPEEEPSDVVQLMFQQRDILDNQVKNTFNPGYMKPRYQKGFSNFVFKAICRKPVKKSPDLKDKEQKTLGLKDHISVCSTWNTTRGKPDNF